MSLKQKDEEEKAEIIEGYFPPTNFSIVEAGLYRSSYPTMKSFGFLKKLKLKTILTLVGEEYPEKNIDFMKKNNIELIQIGLRPNKEPFVEVQQEKIVLALGKILDVRNHPMLIHCNSGKHRTGTVIGCVRKIQKWCLSSIFAEYIRFAFPKHRVLDQQFIELFDSKDALLHTEDTHLPSWARGRFSFRRAYSREDSIEIS